MAELIDRRGIGHQNQTHGRLFGRKRLTLQPEDRDAQPLLLELQADGDDDLFRPAGAGLLRLIRARTPSRTAASAIPSIRGSGPTIRASPRTAPARRTSSPSPPLP